MREHIRASRKHGGTVSRTELVQYGTLFGLVTCVVLEDRGRSERGRARPRGERAVGADVYRDGSDGLGTRARVTRGVRVYADAVCVSRAAEI